MNYLKMSKNDIESEKSSLLKEYEAYKAKGLSLNMARGKPSPEQLDLSLPLFDSLKSTDSYLSADGIDCRNYGEFDGIPECKHFFADLLEIDPDNVFVGGNSSLNMMFDTISCFMTAQIYDDTLPWHDVKDRKFLCPVPGYDRHFGITGYFGFEMIPIPMDENGPDMDMVEELVSKDPSIKGIWCVPKYSNPTGITYSDEVVKRFAALKPAAKDFRIMWDNAYAIHDVTDTPDKLLNIMDECKKNGNEDLPIIFCSTSKITFSGAGVAALATSSYNIKVLKKRLQYATIGYDKLNMLRHMRFFKNFEGLLNHMEKHKAILAPKFKTVIEKLNTQLGDTEIAEWTNPNGGYFVSVNVYKGTAKRVVELCKEAGVVLTGAGATYPYGIDPDDKNIRIAPSFPSVDELAQAMDVFCVCVKLAALEKLA
ncbi:MAG: aminotransferase class I/II-fold pyridoxal phosphate-dependent enzyme [Ruminococcus sp.]|nr:aminotransferase class I/II-fold pyridoxal phosphate-dependent enzyme [Ruminococcus sp.]